MSKLFFNTLLFSFFFVVSSDLGASTKINFKQFTFSEVKSAAATEQKQFFAYFYGNWCLGCQIMDETTFTDPKLVEFVKDEFIAVKVDIHSTLGKNWGEEFQITCLPTFLVFDENGILIRRHESTFTGVSMLQMLQQAQYPDMAYANDIDSYVLPNSENQLLISQHIEQFEELLLNGNLKIDPSPLYAHHIATIISSDINFTNTANESLNEFLKQNGSTDLIIREPSFQELPSDSNLSSLSIDTLKAFQVISKPKEFVVSSMVPLERQKTTKAEPSKNTLIKKMYSNGAYNIQFGKYGSYNDATVVIKQLKLTFLDKEVFLLIDKNGSYRTYQVLVKGFASQEEASSFLTALKEMNLKLQ